MSPRGSETWGPWTIYVYATGNRSMALSSVPGTQPVEVVPRKQFDEARGLLRRLREWDHMQTAGDGPYWLREIAKVLDDQS